MLVDHLHVPDLHVVVEADGLSYQTAEEWVSEK